MQAEVLFMDYSFHCNKIYTQTGGFSCLCEFNNLPDNVTDRQLACERRKASFLGLLAATRKEYDLEFSSASLLGASIATDFMHGDLPVAELSSILGPDVPVQAFFHTSVLFQLRPSNLSQERPSWELFNIIRHIAPLAKG